MKSSRPYQRTFRRRQNYGKRNKDTGAEDSGGTLRKDQGASEQIWPDAERIHHRAHRDCAHRRRGRGRGRIKSIHHQSRRGRPRRLKHFHRRITMYIYPDNLAAKATLWLWELKNLAIIGIGFLIGIFSLVRTGALLPLALVVAYGFLSIRFDNTSILDFIRYAAAYFFTRQQYFEWRDPT